MEDWAEKEAEAVRQKRKQDQIDKEARLLEDKQKNAEAPRLWKEFVKAVSSKVKDFNRALGEDALSLRNDENDDVTVGVHDFLTIVSARFDKARLEVRCMMVSDGCEYSIEVKDGHVTFVKGRSRSDVGAHAITPEQMAQEFVTGITRFA